MPYPKPNDPDYCPQSNQPVENFDPQAEWHRCPGCGRLIAAKPKQQTFFPHVSNRKRARRGDAVQEGLTAHGLNRKEPRELAVYGPAET